MTSGDANRNCNSFPDVMDHDLVSDTETDLSIDIRQTSQHDCRDPFDDNHQSLDVDYQNCTLWKIGGAEQVSYSSFPPFILLSSCYIRNFKKWLIDIMFCTCCCIWFLLYLAGTNIWR